MTAKREAREKRKWSRARKVLLAIAAVFLVLGGVAAWLFLFPAKPPITAETGLSCQAVAECSEDCALRCPSGVRKLPCMRKCASRCTEHGCDSARTPYKDLTGCVGSECLLECITGPDADCARCTAAKCARAKQVCERHSCSSE